MAITILCCVSLYRVHLTISRIRTDCKM